AKFSKWWRQEFKAGDLPTEGLVYDYFLEGSVSETGVASAVWRPWTDTVPEYDYQPEQQMRDRLVETAQTRSMHYLMDLFLKNRDPFMLAGMAGTGKTSLVVSKLRGLSEEAYLHQIVNLNYYTDTMQLQMMMEKNLEKKVGKNYGPTGNKRLVYHIDDLNMAQVDLYGTQAPITLLRQHRDYTSWYDREKLTLKHINNVQFTACMNPTSGSFTINERFQRHFSVLAVDFPSDEDLKTIYSSIVTGHFNQGFSGKILTAPSPALPSECGYGSCISLDRYGSTLAVSDCESVCVYVQGDGGRYTLEDSVSWPSAPLSPSTPHSLAVHGSDLYLVSGGDLYTSHRVAGDGYAPWSQLQRVPFDEGYLEALAGGFTHIFL
ncbi:dynein heavy chain, partial [Kipferlia bialata]